MDWHALRDEFPITRRWAFFDHAAVAPLTARAQRAINAYATDLAENGDAFEPAWVRRVEEVRRLCGRLLNADPLDVAFVKNTSEGLGILAEGLDWQPGDNVVTAAEEYPSNLYPWMNLAARGVELRRVPSRGPRVDPNDLRAALDERTRVLALSFVEYASGFRNDLAALGQLCRERGILFVVDAIQGLGVLPFDVRQLPVDAAAACGHKWLLGAQGAAILYVRRGLLDRLHPVGVGWNSVVNPRDFSTIDFTLKPHAGRWESGTLNVAGITALGASLELLLEIGIPAVEQRLFALTEHLCDRARAAGLAVFSSRGSKEWSGIVSLTGVERQDRDPVQQCREAGIIINRRAGRLRISPHVYNTEEEIDQLVEVLRASAA